MGRFGHADWETLCKDMLINISILSGEMSARDGDHVPQDYAMARQVVGEAASQGDVMAQDSLSRVYSKGYGVPQDFVSAYMWFSLAAAHSTSDAQKSVATNRDGALTRRMNPGQSAEAHKLAREWRPKTP